MSVHDAIGCKGFLVFSSKDHHYALYEGLPKDQKKRGFLFLFLFLQRTLNHALFPLNEGRTPPPPNRDVGGKVGENSTRKLVSGDSN